MVTKSAWHAVALSDDIASGDVHPIELDGTELALWRNNDGQAHVWIDKCPHRGMRLSFGFVRDNRLTCLYHGWQYGTDGACRKIPAHPDLEPPATLCTDAMEVAEAHGMIFVGKKRETVPETTGHWRAVRSVFLDCSANDALLQVKNFAGRKFSTVGAVLLSEEQDLALSIQPRGDNASVLHLSTLNTDPEGRLELARALVARRRQINSGGQA